MPLVNPEMTPESIRTSMAIPSTPGLRGLRDGVGFATTPEAMAAVVAASSSPPSPARLGPAPSGPVVGVLCPHDDFLYAGRVYRAALESITAKTVVIVGTFHGFRHFEQDGLGFFDEERAWWTPDGPVACAPLRERLRSHPIIERPFRVDPVAFDLEHSIEPIVAWLRHRRPDLEILPFLPAGSESIDAWFMGAQFLGGTLAEELDAAGLELGRDVQVVISADAIHYGPDFGETRYGLGADAAEQAKAEDLRILGEFLSGEIVDTSTLALHETFVDWDRPHGYRWTWCGRFAIPFGVLALASMAPRGHALFGWPLAYETSISAPPLDVHMPPLGFTAPASVDHFVGYPAVAFTFAPSSKA